MEIQTLLIPATLIYSACSLTSMVLFTIDKRAAKTRARRIPEATLHTVELLGGWPGAFLAMRFLHHKSAKHRYRLITMLIALGHISVWVGLLFLI